VRAVEQSTSKTLLNRQGPALLATLLGFKQLKVRSAAAHLAAELGSEIGCGCLTICALFFLLQIHPGAAAAAPVADPALHTMQLALQPHISSSKGSSSRRRSSSILQQFMQSASVHPRYQSRPAIAHPSGCSSCCRQQQNKQQLARAMLQQLQLSVNCSSLSAAARVLQLLNVHSWQVPWATAAAAATGVAASWIP
jgi:hypothetical protein